MTKIQMSALTNAQKTALTTASLDYTSPLVLDLSGNGITTQSISAGAEFDLNGTGQAVNTGWISGTGEGLLVYDPTNGPITSGSQLFGTATVLPNGQKAANGFAALAALDSNGDGVINSSDAGWSNLKVWVGESSTGSVQGGNLESLDSLGLVQLNLAYSNDPTMNNGNIIGMVSSFVTSDGQTHEMADVWFLNSPISAISSLTPSQIAALAPPQIPVLGSVGGLNSQVGGLAHTLSSFKISQPTNLSFSGIPAINPPLDTVVASSATRVIGMVSALQQFGSNGNLAVASPVINSVSTGTLLSSLSNSSFTGVLVSGGK